MTFSLLSISALLTRFTYLSTSANARQLGAAQRFHFGEPTIVSREKRNTLVYMFLLCSKKDVGEFYIYMREIQMTTPIISNILSIRFHGSATKLCITLGTFGSAQRVEARVVHVGERRLAWRGGRKT